MAEYRAIAPADHEQFRRFTRYAFAPQQGPLDADGTQSVQSDLFDLRGLYDDELTSGCKRYHFEAYVREGTETVGGLGAVATPPEHRRQGYARELCREVCREYADEGVSLVALWPFSTPFYRQMGWATVNDLYEFRLEPSTLPAHDPRGQYRRLGVDDWERLRPVEAAFGAGVTLSMRRSEPWWRERTLTNWTGGTEPFVYGYERDGDLAGYLVYTVAEGDTNERTLSVETFGSVDEEAHRSLLEFLRRHGAQVDRVELLCATDSQLLALVDDPGEVTCERVPGPMARLTSLDALDGLDWSGLDRPLTVAVEDPLLPANDARVRLSADGVESISGDDTDAVSGDEPDIRVDIGTLTQLYVGRYDPAAAERVAGLTMVDDSRRALAEIFPERQVCLREFF
jgi:predicted acetyltransferase